jgi:hypothetical protein
MAAILQLRRGTTAAKPTLFAGEMYVNTTSQSLQLSIDGSTEITLAKLNSVNSGSFNVSGDITLGGTITIGDNTVDNVVFNADLSSSIIPNNNNSFDLGSNSFKYRNLYAVSITGSTDFNTIVNKPTLISGSAQVTAGSTTNFATDVKTQLNSNTVISSSAQIISITASVSGTGSTEIIRATMGDSDYFRILVGATVSNGGFAEISTADDGVEPIHIRQYTGNFASLIRTATLLDDTGNTSFPQRVTANSFVGSISASNGVISGSSQLTLLNAFTASTNTFITDINTKTGSFETKNLSLATISGSLILTASFLEAKNLTLVTTTGSLISTASFLEAKNLTLATTTGSLILSSSTDSSKFITIASVTASYNSVTASLNTYTASAETKFTSISTITASLNTYTASAETKFTSISTVTGSLISTASFLEAKNLSLATISGSLISTASFLEGKNLTLATTTGSLILSSSTDASKFVSLATYTSSLNVWTSSVATTGSNTFIGNEVITGSLTVTGSVKGNVVPITIASLTASLDMNLGSYFTLTLANTVTTHIRATNITPGMSATLLITTGTNSTASLSPLLLQPSGSVYSASIGVGRKDVLSLVSFDSTNMYVVSTKAMQ